jgi:hypothetical protein
MASNYFSPLFPCCKHLQKSNPFSFISSFPSLEKMQNAVYSSVCVPTTSLNNSTTTTRFWSGQIISRSSDLTRSYMYLYHPAAVKVHCPIMTKARYLIMVATCQCSSRLLKMVRTMLGDVANACYMPERSSLISEYSTQSTIS